MSLMLPNITLECFPFQSTATSIFVRRVRVYSRGPADYKWLIWKGLRKENHLAHLTGASLVIKSFIKLTPKCKAQKTVGKQEGQEGFSGIHLQLKKKKSSSSTKYPSFYQAMETLLFSSDPHNVPRIEVSIWPKVSDFILVGNCGISTPPKCVYFNGH